MVWLVMKLQPLSLSHLPRPIHIHVSGEGQNMKLTRLLGAVPLCFWFVEECSAPTDLEVKQDHDLVLRDLILACADYESQLR